MVRDIDFPDNVERLGSVDPRTYRDALRRSAFVVIPAHPLAYPTGQSVLVDAMMMRRAVIASDGPALRSYLPDSAGMLVRPGDSGALAASVQDMMADEERREALAGGVRLIA